MQVLDGEERLSQLHTERPLDIMLHQKPQITYNINIRSCVRNGKIFAIMRKTQRVDAMSVN
jgi:hypothetical protein